jgi:3-deoxy-D-manno-octulosonate 8-phosphate phosphatase (KDO 8-P phosphatase)
MKKNKLPLELIRSLRLLVFDFDGVFTDNRVLVMDDGREAVFCSRADGWGLGKLRKSGMQLLVISTETNPVVSKRCQKLKIDCIQGCEDKLAILHAEILKRGVAPEAVAFMGNDENDIDCMRNVGLPVAVADAYPEIKSVAKIITSCPGGHGAVREFCDLIMQEKKGGQSHDK